DRRLESERLLREREELELAMRVVQHDRGRSLVDLARLDANQAVLDVVDPSHSVPARDLADRLDQLDAVERSVSKRPRPPALEADLDLLGVLRSHPWVGRPLKGLGRRLNPGVLEDSSLDGTAPEVLVGAENGFPGGLDLDAVLGGKLELL